MTNDDAVDIVIWGASGHAKVVADAIRCAGLLRARGFIDDLNPDRRGQAFCGATVLGGRDRLDGLWADGVRLMALAFGDNTARLRLADEMSALGFRFPVLVHPRAVVAEGVEIGAGSFVAAGAIVNAGARIGRQVIVNSGAIVEHDCDVGDGAHLSPRACLAGGVTVGRGAWVGAGATVRGGLGIGAGSVIGMGSVVLRSIADGVVAYGCPAVEHRKVEST